MYFLGDDVPVESHLDLGVVEFHLGCPSCKKKLAMKAAVLSEPVRYNQCCISDNTQLTSALSCPLPRAGTPGWCLALPSIQVLLWGCSRE